MKPDKELVRAGETASTSMRDLARASITIDNPSNLYPLLGELLASLRAIAQVTDQLAKAHTHHRGRARTDDGDGTVGSLETGRAVEALTQARELLDAAECAIDLASESSGRIAWAPEDGTERWLSVIFLQGDQAHAALELIRQRGPGAAIECLSQWDFGDETTEAALINGYVYDGIPNCPTDRLATDPSSRYVLEYNPSLEYVSLLRNYRSDAMGAVDSAPGVVTNAPESTSRTMPTWFESASAGMGHRAPSVSL